MTSNIEEAKKPPEEIRDEGLEDDDDDDDEEFNEDGFLYNIDDLELQDLDEESIQYLKSIMNEAEGAGGGDEVEKTEKEKAFSSSKALVPTKSSDDDDDEINSDEEREILKGIRDEIEGKVRDEMKDEIADYKEKLKALENGPPDPNSYEQMHRDIFGHDEDMDPKLKEAIEKMNKLDKILRKKVKKEKEVKRDRILFERRLKQEIAEMDHGVSHYREIKVNTEKYLALEPPPSHNAGVKVDEDDEEMPPLFQTQIDDPEVLWQKGRMNVPEGNEGPDPDSLNFRAHLNRKGSIGSQASSRGAKAKQKKKDFIKRNKELAADAAQPIAMTDDEKKRLQDLLVDVDEMPELNGNEDMPILVEMNAFHVAVPSGQGFSPDKVEQKHLIDIDAKLKAIMPDEDYLSITQDYASVKGTPQPRMFSRVGLPANGEIPDRFGERVLYETKEERELKARLQSIEQELDRFKAPQKPEFDGETDFHLTDEQLDNLLDECAHSMSRISFNAETPDLSARSVMSSRQALMDNPPRLTDEQLQQLLSEAHFPLSSTLLALRDDDSKIEEEQGDAEAITAETWKAINEAKISEREQYLTESFLSSEREQNFSQNAVTELGGDDKGEKTNRSSVLQSFDTDNLLPDSRLQTPMSTQDIESHSVTSSIVSREGNSHDSILPRISDGRFHRSASKNELENDLAVRSLSNFSDVSDSSESVRLPEIKSNSFLIQTTQGLNNDTQSGRENSRTGPPLQMVHNDLSNRYAESSRSSISELEDGGSYSQSRSRKLSNGFNSPLVPKPPSSGTPTKKPIPKH